MKKLITTVILLTPFIVFAMEGRDNRENERGFGRNNSSVAFTTPLNVLCITSAIEKRENAIIAGHDAFNTSIKQALEARKTGLKSAWSLSTAQERKSARQTVWKTFRDSVQSAHSNMKSARKNAWNTFNTDMQACGVKYHDEKSQEISLPNNSL